MGALFTLSGMTDDLREEQRAWLRAVLAQTGLSPTKLAAKAGVSQPTITRFLNDPDATHNLTARTVAAIERATGMRYGPEPRPAALREPESEPFKGELPGGIDIGALVGLANGVDPWRLRSRALEAAGFMPGDILIVDLNAEAAPGDVVCAQIYDWARSKAETIFRLWEPPYLQVATFDPALRKIFVVDNYNVVIRGVVKTSLRGRTGRTAR